MSAQAKSYADVFVLILTYYSSHNKWYFGRMLIYAALSGPKGGKFRVSEYVDIERVVRPMRGKSRSVLTLGRDQNYYVVKEAGDMARNRKLVNECLGHVVLKALSVTTPDITTVRVCDADALRLYSGHHLIGNSLSAGLHFGSRLPRDPRHSTIYDFLPKKLLPAVCNPQEFASVFAMDVWLCNAATRQQVFVFEPQPDDFRKIRAYFIDNEAILSGAYWSVEELNVHARFQDSTFLHALRTGESCFEAVKAIDGLNMDLIAHRAISLSRPWLSRDEESRFVQRLQQLAENRMRLGYLVETILAAYSRDAHVLGVVPSGEHILSS